MNILDKFLNKITMYQAMLYFLRVLIAAAVVFAYFDLIAYEWWHIVANMVLFLVFCWGSNQFLGRLFGVKPNYESQYITGEILTLIVGPLNPLTDWWAIFFISFLAMASKYVLVFNKRHAFNPAAFGVLASALLIGQGASWWIGGKYMLPFIIVGGLLVARKLKWMHLIIAFLLAYVAMLGLTLIARGADLSVVWYALNATFRYSGTVFFALVMLVEPLTAPRTKNYRIMYGAGVAIAMVMIPIVFPTYGYSIETALLLGNLATFLLTFKKGRYTLKFSERIQESKDTYSLWFEPSKKIDYQAGQYMEWTLPHAKNDSRGIRRYFTIASSPTEKRIRLVTKTNPKMSTFKQALMKMAKGDELTVSSLEGEFILPEKPRKLAFIAGGVGITPFLSMIQYMHDSQKPHDAVLFYANKTVEEIGFRSFFEEAKLAGVKTIYVVAENAPADWTGETGFITKEMIEKQTPDWKERTFYVSGPEPMVVAYVKLLLKMGLPRKQLKRDYFPGY